MAISTPARVSLAEATLWVGNFGDAFINNYDPNMGAFIYAFNRKYGLV